MKMKIDLYDFRREFENIRPDNFSREGLTMLFDYFEELDESTDEETELDVIAICCDYRELELFEAAEEYSVCLEHCDGNLDEEIEEIKNYFTDRCSFVGLTDGGNIIINSF